MLIPDAEYIKQRPGTTDHHLTVAYFGPIEAISPEGMFRLRSAVQSLARFMGGPIEATANGVGIFNAGPDNFALVDLIDGIGTFNCRTQVENLFGAKRTGYRLDDVKVSYSHGFTPHITRSFSESPEINIDLIDNLSFTFTAIGLWFGVQRYEVAL